MIGLWKGVDGASIMLAHGYDYGRRWKDEDLSESNYLLELSKRNPFNIVYRYYGTGDTGGSPNLASVRSVEKGIKGDGPVEVISAKMCIRDSLYTKGFPQLSVLDLRDLYIFGNRDWFFVYRLFHNLPGRPVIRFVFCKKSQTDRFTFLHQFFIVLFIEKRDRCV